MIDFGYVYVMSLSKVQFVRLCLTQLDGLKSVITSLCSTLPTFVL